jgi:hypothetical protein
VEAPLPEVQRGKEQGAAAQHHSQQQSALVANAKRVLLYPGGVEASELALRRSDVKRRAINMTAPFATCKAASL